MTDVQPDISVRLGTAQWLLERQLAWIAAAEVKVGVIVALDTALLAALAAAFGASSGNSGACTYFFILGAAGAAVIGLVCGAIVVVPRTRGPGNSLLFFGNIAAIGAKLYAERFKLATEEEFLTDLIEQIYRNAEIADTKYIWVRRSMSWSFVAGILWVVALGLLVKL